MSSKLRAVQGVALALGVAWAQGSLLADGVTRAISNDSGTYKVTLTWSFSGTIESDLVLEERLPDGWNVNTATVLVDGTLDAAWFSDSIARFAVSTQLLAQTQSISFELTPGPATADNTIDGDWRIYQDGRLLKGECDGARTLAAPVGLARSSTRALAAPTKEVAVAIKSFKVLADAGVELEYAGLPAAGILVVEGCEGLDKSWQEAARAEVAAGDGKVELDAAQIGACRFMRMKLLTKEQE